MAEVYDLAVIGGGINGCGIARDAAGRGLSVHLCEMNDLASGTSSWSTKLVHGGLRYLEYYEFRLVREALFEREILWRMAPHVIEPLRFVLPHHRGLRPAWFLRLGLFIYDHLGGRKLLPATSTLDLVADEAGKPLKPGLFTKGFEYSDCRVDDARLVVLNARDAAARGAVIETRSRAVRSTRGPDGWTIELEARDGGMRKTIRARAVINAAGPWVADVLAGSLGCVPKAKVRLVQGSHIVVRRLYDHDRCYIFQNADGRIVFAIPYERDFTLIGTTDLDYRGDPAAVHATEAEIAYLLAAAGEYFREPIRRDDVVWSYSGVRPLYDDGASEAKEATRDYVFDLDDTVDGAPLLSIFGGKITTYRRLAEAALKRLEPKLGRLAPAWTAGVPLPGGDFSVDGRPSLEAALRTTHPWLDAALARRLVATYGTEASRLLDGVADEAGLGKRFGADLSEREVDWLIDEEWACSAEDILWRRTKLGLRIGQEDAAALEAHVANKRTKAAAETTGRMTK